MNQTNTESKSEMYMKVDEVCKLLEVSPSYAYRVIKELNKELSEKGFWIISGKVSRKYFNERFYGGKVG